MTSDAGIEPLPATHESAAFDALSRAVQARFDAVPAADGRLYEVAAPRSRPALPRPAAKMHPLAYQRPQAAPTAGTIAQAERLFAQLGLEPALRRRFARLDEIPTLWRPVEAAAPQTGIFGRLKARQAPVPEAALDMPAQAVT